jgi:hypothetical protein
LELEDCLPVFGLFEDLALHCVWVHSVHVEDDFEDFVEVLLFFLFDASRSFFVEVESLDFSLVPDGLQQGGQFLRFPVP